jgi:tetraacyldisaccharide 4'-kinase
MSKPMRGDMPWWEAALRGYRKGLLAESLRRVARLSSLGYEAGVKGRDIAYRRGWLKSKRLPQPTICVGNITVGGTGKTPLVLRLVQDLQAKGLRPAVLLRGYKRKEMTPHPVLVRDADGIRARLLESGDEAMELATRLPGAVVGVGADRYAVGRYLLERCPIDCFVLDDGFQHHRLQRDINIVTLDVSDPWGGGRLLPAGFLRERPEALIRADAVVLTRTASVAPDRLRVVRAQVSGFLRPDACVLESRHEPTGLVPLQGGENRPLSALRGREVIAISGIGRPASFELSLTKSGARIVQRRRFADHAGDASEIWRWARARRRAGQWVVMTEKDAMRWAWDPTFNPPADAFALRMRLRIVGGQNHWDRLLEVIGTLAHAG